MLQFFCCCFCRCFLNPHNWSEINRSVVFVLVSFLFRNFMPNWINTSDFTHYGLFNRVMLWWLFRSVFFFLLPMSLSNKWIKKWSLDLDIRVKHCEQHVTFVHYITQIPFYDGIVFDTRRCEHNAHSAVNCCFRRCVRLNCSNYLQECETAWNRVTFIVSPYRISNEKYCGPLMKMTVTHSVYSRDSIGPLRQYLQC